MAGRTRAGEVWDEENKKLYDCLRKARKETISYAKRDDMTDDQVRKSFYDMARVCGNQLGPAKGAAAAGAKKPAASRATKK